MKNLESLKEKTCGIYMIKNVLNDKVYIGQSVDVKSRMWQHKYKLKYNKHDNEFLQSDYNEYGVKAFQYMLVEECFLSDLDERERYWLNFYKAQGLAYNILKGGTKNFGDNENNNNAKAVICLETKETYKTIKEASLKTGICASSISKVVRGIREVAGNCHWEYVNPESFKPHNAVNMKCSEERKRNISQGVKKTNKINNKDVYWKGKHHSEDSKLKISKARQGRTYPSQQGINSKSSVQLKCVETNQVFESIKAAEKEIGISGIGKIYNNPNATAGGYHWVQISKEEYLNEISFNC